MNKFPENLQHEAFTNFLFYKMTNSPLSKKAYLIILDGYGLGNHDAGDAIFNGKSEYIDGLMKQYGYAQLKTHGAVVGLPEFQTGGSEVGHITIGAGREVKHLLTKINDQIDSGKFFTNEKLKRLMQSAKKQNILHITGLMSDGGIHSFIHHISGVVQMAQQANIENIYVHAILDGRDVGERTAKKYLTILDNLGIKIASIGGRFYGMDRDNNWERVEEAVNCMIGVGSSVEENWKTALDTYYKISEDSDYYMPPVLLEKSGVITKDSVVININYRTDRMMMFSQKLLEFGVSSQNYGIFGPYSDDAIQPFNFGVSSVKNTIGEVVANAGGAQLRISETEKFNHVTFFMSGQTKIKFQNEERILVPSPKCKSYAEKPEMSAREQTDALIEKVEKNEYNLIIQNYANADLVGHSGSEKAVEKAVEVLDECLKKIIPFALKKGYQVFITADHGNGECMFTENGEVNSSHTKNFVPFIMVDENKILKHRFGSLQDIAPTLLKALELDIPKEMTGVELY
ncbi:TPA: 2,3-bisphosphoglycerate-independent phosphoglycerate mutase [Candidatus Gracilibacteria bacterium]|nr:2,3-bisphosphoglycerate-independent phosphoglycerate mutase [Candidatus Gracilibacteria bacterium]